MRNLITLKTHTITQDKGKLQILLPVMYLMAMFSRLNPLKAQYVSVIIVNVKTANVEKETMVIVNLVCQKRKK